jgi:small nuclear ribonucleoprotein (snRNP)-like protein
MSDRAELEQLTGEEVIVKLSGGREVVGTLDSHENDFSLTLTGSGTPDKPTLGQMGTEYVDGRETFNGSNVESVVKTPEE